MTELEVEIEDTARGGRQTFRFARSPIRIGRSQLNDLPIAEPFVSHCHAVVRFDAAGVHYVDLGSTNGSALGASALPKNTPVPVAPGTPVRICSLLLRFRATAPSGARNLKLTYSQLGRSNAGFTLPPAAPAPYGAVPGSPGAFGAAPGTHDAGSARLVATYEAYRETWRQLFAQIVQEVEARPPHEREAFVASMLERCPELPQEAAFRRWLGTDGAVAARPGGADGAVAARPGGADGTGLLAQRLGLPEGIAGAAFVERVATLLARFAHAFVELRRGHDQFVDGMGLGLVVDRTPLTTANEETSVLAYLLDPNADASRLDELTRAYGDLMLHQVALLGACAEGARELVLGLRPNGAALARAPRPWLGFLFGTRTRLREIERRIADLSEESTLSSVLFGRAFARAYAAVLGRGTPNPSPTTLTVR